MNGGYKKAMDGIRFSEAAKERMARNLVAAQGASHAPAASATRQARERTLVRARVGGKRRWQAVAAAAAAVGVLAVLGGAAYASGALMTMAEAVDAAVTGAPAPTEIVDKVGRPVGAGASSNGVTVTAEAIFGDRENYAIVYSIAKDDGTAFDLPPKTDSGTLPLRFQEGSPTASVSDTRSTSGTAYFYDADPADNAIQYIERTSVNQDGGSVIGKTARAHFGNLCEAESGNMVAPGDWNIKFVIDYEDLATSIPAGQTFHLDGMSATVDSLELSPVALTATYTVQGTKDWEGSGSGLMSEHDAYEAERFRAPLFVTMADGTVIDASNSGGSSVERDGTTVCHFATLFETIIDVDDVVSVTVGDVTIPLR